MSADLSPSPSSPDPQSRLAHAKRAVTSGVISILVGLLLIPSPILLGRGMLNKYIVVIGVLAVCIGGSLVLHGGLDWLRERRR